MAKKYYWIKLKTDFFDLETIDWLISQKNGCEYVVLYQKLCLLTANKDGELVSAIGEIIIPYDAGKIARDTKFPIDTVIVALELFKKIGLIYEQENGILKIPYITDIVGSETEYAKKKRDYRDKLKTMSETMSLTLSDKSIDIDLEKEKEKDIDTETNKDISLSGKPDGECVSAPESSKKKKSFDKQQAENDFEECWKIYPKKQGKAKALKSYMKFAEKEPDLKEKVISGIRNYIEEIRRENKAYKFIKNGDTYFNNESWNDEYDVKVSEENEPDFRSRNPNDAPF